MYKIRLQKKLYFVLALWLIPLFSSATLFTPSITSPINFSTNVLNKTVVNISSTGATYFVLEYDSVSTLNSNYRKKLDKVSSPSITLDSLPFNTTIYLRVKAYNSSLTDSSPWSSKVQFTTHSGILNLISMPYYAVLIESWTSNSINSVEIEVDTVSSFNSIRLMALTTGPTLSACYIKYTKASTKYYVRFRSKYGSMVSNWINSSPVVIKKGFNYFLGNPLDSFNTFKYLNIGGYYNNDPKAWYHLQIDTTTEFNSVNLFDTITHIYNYVFRAKPKQSYYMKISLHYNGDVWYDDSIYRFNTAKGSPPYSFFGGVYQFIVPPGYTGVSIEIDSSLKFNSPIKTKFDSTVFSSASNQYFIKKYLSIITYKNKYLRYRIYNSAGTLNWYCTNQRFLFPPTYVQVSHNPPSVATFATVEFDIFKGITYEADTTLKFNSPLKQRASISRYDRIEYLKFGLKYYIKFKNFNFTGDTTQWGPPMPLYTFSNVQVLYPDNNPMYFPDLKLINSNWKGVITYHWQLDTDSGFIKPSNYFLAYNTPVNGKDLAPNRKYYWRMRMISPVDTSGWMNGSFDYKVSTVLPFPFLIHPPNKAQKISPAEVTFIWKDQSAGITSNYEFILTDPQGNRIMGSLGKETVHVKNLKTNTTYTWFVRSFGKTQIPLTESDATKYTFTTSTNAGFLPQLSNDKILVYPNPVNTQLNVMGTNGYRLNFITIRTVDGKLMFKSPLIDDVKGQLDITFLKPGLYFMECELENGVVFSKFTKN